jgi:hypothetical protein
MSVIANLAMSLDGFIAWPDDTPGPLFEFYEAGATELRVADGWPASTWTSHRDRRRPRW